MAGLVRQRNVKDKGSKVQTSKVPAQLASSMVTYLYNAGGDFKPSLFATVYNTILDAILTCARKLT